MKTADILRNICFMERAFYERVHKWIAKNYGKASYCSFCAGEKAKRFEWALIKGMSHDYNVNNYIPLCPSCHRKYDITEETRKKMSARMKKNPPTHRLTFHTGKFGGQHPTAKPIIKIDPVTLEPIREYESLVDAMREHGYKHSTLSMCLTGRNQTAYGFKWKFKNSRGND